MDWDLIQIFLQLRLEYWDNKLPIIEIYYTDIDILGSYIYPKNKEEDQ